MKVRDLKKLILFFKGGGIINLSGILKRLKAVEIDPYNNNGGGGDGDNTIKFGEALNQVCFLENQIYGKPYAFLLVTYNLFSLNSINLENPITVGGNTFNYAFDANSQNCKFKTFDELVQDDFSEDFNKAYFCWKLEKIDNNIEIPEFTLYNSPYPYQYGEYYYNIFGHANTPELVYYDGEYYLVFEYEGD